MNQRVKIPTTVEEADLMIRLGVIFLAQHAPEKLHWAPIANPSPETLDLVKTAFHPFFPDRPSVEGEDGNFYPQEG